MTVTQAGITITLHASGYDASIASNDALYASIASYRLTINYLFEAELVSQVQLSEQRE
jgi:hypothetical protein